MYMEQTAPSSNHRVPRWVEWADYAHVGRDVDVQRACLFVKPVQLAQLRLLG